MFHHYDRDNKGTLDYSEFRSAVRRDGKMNANTLHDKDLQLIFHKVDFDDSGEIDLHEFTAWLANPRDASKYPKKIPYIKGTNQKTTVKKRRKRRTKKSVGKSMSTVQLMELERSQRIQSRKERKIHTTPISKRKIKSASTKKPSQIERMENVVLVRKETSDMNRKEAKQNKKSTRKQKRRKKQTSHLNSSFGSNTSRDNSNNLLSGAIRKKYTNLKYSLKKTGTNGREMEEKLKRIRKEQEKFKHVLNKKK